MKNFLEFIINKNCTCLQALHKLDSDKSNQTLFVIDENERLIGTVTDGDIRRGLIRGLTLSTAIYEYSFPHFYYINGKVNVSEISRLKHQGIKLLPKLNDSGQIEKVYDLSRLKSLLPLHAVIMAGGKGERLRPLTEKIPKPMLPLGGKPILEHSIDHLIAFGIENITISVNYLGEQIISYFGDGKSKGITINYIKEEKPLGTIGSITLLERIEYDSLIILNSDLFTNIDLEDFYLAFENEKAEMAIATIPYSVDIPYAILEFDDNCIISLKEKPKNTYYANAGIYLIKREVINFIPENSFFNATDLMERLIYKKSKLIHNPITGYWIDIGMQDDYKKAKEIVRHL